MLPSINDLAPIPRRYILLQCDAGDIGTPFDNFKLLEQFAVRIRTLAKSESSIRNSLTLPAVASIHPSQKHTLAILVAFLTEAADTLHSFVRESLDEINDFISALMQFMKYNTAYNVDAGTFVADMRAVIDGSEKIQRLRFMKAALEAKVQSIVRGFPAPDYARLTREALARTHDRVKEDQKYVGVSAFDSALSHYVEESSLKDMIEPTVVGILEGGVDGSLVTIATMADVLAGELLSEQSRSIALVCYCGLVRLLFEEAYCRKREVSRFVKEDGLFLIKCKVIAESPARGLRFSEGFKARCQAKMRVASLFREKQVELISRLDYVVNPLDIEVLLHRAYAPLRMVFGESQAPVSSADAELLLLCLIAVNPPANAVSIARFLAKWEPLSLIQEAVVARNAFIEAVDQIASMPMRERDSDSSE